MKKIVAITLTSCFLLSACNSDSRPVLDETINFDLTNQAPAKISYEISVNGDVSNLAYLGTPVEINISLINECSSIEVGFMLFSDGIPLHTTIDGKEAVMHIFHIDDEKTESFTVSFIPYGESGKTVALQPVSILYPSFSLSDENTNFGFYHRFLTTAPIELKLEETNLFGSSVYTNYENILANETTKEKYGIKGNSGDANYMFYQSDNDRKNFLSLDNNGSFDFISFDTTVNANVRICFFLNGQLVSFNNGYNYMEISLKKDYITKSENIKLSLVFIGWQPVFITTKCPFGILFNSSTVIKERSIICKERLLPSLPLDFDIDPLRTVCLPRFCDITSAVLEFGANAPNKVH